MGFKKIRGLAMSEERQGLIRYTCLTYRDQPAHTQNKIRRLCNEAGGAHAAAIWEVMCTKDAVAIIAARNHVSESVLYEGRRRFYESW